MKKTVPILIMSLLSGMSLPAANIAWVSFHSADDAPTANATSAGFTNAPDIGYTTLLKAKGHNVTRFVSVDNLDQNPDVIDALNTNDLVIISRSVGSGHYEVATETAAWNSSITVPMIVTGGYLTRSSRLGFTTGTTVPDVNSNPVRLRVNVPAHPIFEGVALDATNTMVNPYSQIVTFTNANTGVTTVQRGISVNNNTVAAGGTVLAVVGTAGDAALNGMVIGEFRKGVTLNSRDVLAANRLVLLTGSRENSITSEGAGIYDLLPDGEKLFLNGVNYLLSTYPPKFLTQISGATNLMAGDRWTFSPTVTGTDPMTYQWYKDGQAIPTATDLTYSIPSLTTADAGEYFMIVTNELGKATSSVARLEFIVFPAASITNGIISYWPLDTLLGTKTPDLVSSYDLTAVNMQDTNVVSGRWGNAFLFNNGSQTMLQRIPQAGEDLPITSKSNFSVSFWVNGPVQSDHRVYSEASTAQNNTLFNIGTHNGGTDGTVDIYIRSDSGALNLDHIHSTAIAYDDAWHHIAYVQRDIGNGQMRAFLYVDGTQDPLVIAPIRPLTATTISIGGILRSAPGAWFTGMIDEVAVWDRALSPQEVAILQVTTITNPPSRLQPLAITSFKADLPAVAEGGSTVLRWDVSKDVSQVTISSVGDVTSMTTGGVGTNAVTPADTTTYILTAKRGVDTLTASTTVAVVKGVTAGWTLLDNFDRYTVPTAIGAPGYWTDARGTSAQVVDLQGNPALKTTTGDSDVFLNLRNFSIMEGEAATLFFRIIPGTNTPSTLTNIVGLTDKGQRGYGDSFLNVGPVVYLGPLTNEAFGIETNAWYLGARNGYLGNNTSPPVDYPAHPLTSDIVYNVWIDVTNNPMADFVSDLFSVYVQVEGVGGRTNLFTDYQSDRDFFYAEPVLGGMFPTLDKLIVLGNNGTYSALFDDFYLSKGGYNATIPKAYGFTGPSGPLPALSIGWEGTQLKISWTTGTLQESSSPEGTWTDVAGAAPPSYTVTPGAGNKFYRARR